MSRYEVSTPSKSESETYPAADGTHYDLKTRLGLSELRSQVWYFDPGEVSIYHLHRQQEELYYLIDGPAQMRLGQGDDEEIIEVTEGSTVKVEPGVPRQLLNETNSPTEWLVVAAPNVREAEIYHDKRGEFLPLDEFMEEVEE